MAKRYLAVLLLFMMMVSCAAAEERWTAERAREWLGEVWDRMAAEPSAHAAENSRDAAAPEEMLVEMPFGTVRMQETGPASWECIREVSVRSFGETDSAGQRIGDAAAEMETPRGGEDRFWFSEETDWWQWTYTGDGILYGKVQTAYDGERCFTLTTVLNREGIIAESRLRVDRMDAQAAAEELAGIRRMAAQEEIRQTAFRSETPVLQPGDLTLSGCPVPGTPVYRLVAVIGEPLKVQSIPDGGRLLLYPDAVIRAGLEEKTGVEIVLEAVVTGSRLTGPRGICGDQEYPAAVKLFRCDQDLFSAGGTLYEEGDFSGDPPVGRLELRGAREMLLHYECRSPDGSIAGLEIGILENRVHFWHIFSGGEAES